MKRFSKTVLIVAALIVFSAAGFAQHVTAEVIGPLTGNLALTYIPGDPCSPASDTITFTGNVHLVGTVDTSQNTVDYHLNLMGVKGTGNNLNILANGSTDLLDQVASPNPSPIKLTANLFPDGPCRRGFASDGALPLTIAITFNSDWTLNTVSAKAGNTCTSDLGCGP